MRRVELEPGLVSLHALLQARHDVAGRRGVIVRQLQFVVHQRVRPLDGLARAAAASEQRKYHEPECRHPRPKTESARSP